MSATTLSLVDGATTIPLAVAGSPNPCAVVVKSYDLGFPDVREVKADLAGQSGTTDLTSLHGGRVVTLAVSILDVPGATKHQTYDLLRAACHPAHRPQLFVQLAGWPQQRVLTLRGQPASCVVGPTHGNFLEATLAWVAPSGVMTSVGTNSTVIAPAVSAGTGISFPITFALAWTPGSATGIQTITNAGTEPTSPVWTFYGGATNVTVSNLTTGALMRIDVTIPDGHYLTVDMGARTAFLDSDPSQSVYGDIDFTVSTWWTIQPGANSVEVQADSSDATAEVFLTWRDVWV